MDNFILSPQKDSTLRQKKQQIQKTPINRVCVLEVPIIPLSTQKSHKALCPRFVSLRTITSGQCRDLRERCVEMIKTAAVFFHSRWPIFKQTPKIIYSHFFLFSYIAVTGFVSMITYKRYSIWKCVISSKLKSPGNIRNIRN